MSMSKSSHATRTSLLGGETSYYPLSGVSSSQAPPPYNPSQGFQSGGYHDREGLGPATGADRFGALHRPSKMYLPNSTWTWAFLLIAFGQAIVCLGLESYVFADFQVQLYNSARGNDVPPPALTIPTYLALFIFGFIYQLVMVWDALRLKNTIQVIGVCLYNLGMLIYASVEIDQVDEAVEQLIVANPPYIHPSVWPEIQPFLVAAPCVIALGTVLLGLVAWKLYHEFAWTIYKQISADVRMKQRFLTYQIYIALLKFDFFFFLGFTVQFLVAVKGTSAAEKYITIVAIPITVILLLAAAFFTRRESYWGQGFVIFVYFAAMAYFIFKLVRIYDSPTSRRLDYEAAAHSLTTFAALTLVLLIVTMITAFMCMRNFNKGLKPHIQRRTTRSAVEAEAGHYNNYEYDGPSHHLGAVPSRMTID